MLRRPIHRGLEPQLCQICKHFQSRKMHPQAKRQFITINTPSRRAKSIQENPNPSTNIGLFATPQVPKRVKQASSLSSRWKSPSKTRAGNGNSPDAARGESSHQTRGGTGTRLQHPRQQPDFANASELIAAVERVTRLFLAQQGIPSEETTLAALRACANADLKLVADAEKPAEEAGQESQSETTASHLLDLDKAGPKTTVTARDQPSPAVEPQDVIDSLSQAAYSIITHPAVVITPRLLQEYVNLQARLGKPETLPHVLALYSSKPVPRLDAGKLRYSAQNPDQANQAINTDAAETALDAAIEAKNLDAAIGVIENSFATNAFRKSKLLKQAVLPGTAFAALPFVIYGAASNLSHLQNTMDSAMATNIAFVGILAYVGFTATIGVVVVTTANDQMKRVTWAPGTPLRQRWLREEERAALDKVACAFGFSESHRYGEEQGAEYQALREYIMRRGMLLDAVELMEGMQ